jgi:CRISPR-associated protein Csb3
VREHNLTGSVTSAFSHLMLVGLAAIQNEVGTAAAIAWSEELLPVPKLVADVTADCLATNVLRHALRHAEESSWVQAQVGFGVRKGTGLFSPRVKQAPLEEWRPYLEDRQRFLDNYSSMSMLDRWLIAALGEPAWWRSDDKDFRPDKGASRWEMKTRNRGEDFVSRRLALLANSVADRTAEQVWDGLTGKSETDEVGGDARDSRTPTGLRIPGPTDNAQAWCALWGLGVLPTVHVSMNSRLTEGMSASPGTSPKTRVAPKTHALPVFTAPTSVDWYRAVVTSKQFDALVEESDDSIDAESKLERDVAREWLTEQGVRAVVRFGVNITGSGNAPERQLLTGVLDVL